MDSNNINRRDFLKLLALFTFSNVGIPYFHIKPQHLSEGTDGVGRLPNILILLFDTFSARHFSLFGYQRATTPNFARFAERGTVYHRHYSGGNFTTPGVASLLTGTYPWSHRGLHYFGTVRDEFIHRNLFSVLAESYFLTAFTHNAFVMVLLEQFQEYLNQITPAKDLAILSEPFTDRLFPGDLAISLWGERVLRASGADLPSSLFLSFIESGFDSFTPAELMRQYGEIYPRGLPNNSTTGLFFLLEQTIDWIQSHVIDIPRPFLGYFHLFPPHEPYTTRKEYIDIFNDGWMPEPKPELAFSEHRTEGYLNEQRRLYDEYIAFVDAEFGRLVDYLDRNGVLEDTYFIVTSDHGQLFERGIHGHANCTLYEPLVHIPLLISKPGQKAREDVLAPTSSVDVLPTLAYIAGKPAPDWCEGQILPTFLQASPDIGRSIYAVDAKSNPKSTPLKIGTVSLMGSRYKLIHYFGYQGKEDDYELYDLENDPDEYDDIYSFRGTLASDLKAELLAKLDDVNREFEG
jgi:hypothetical protein